MIWLDGSGLRAVLNLYLSAGVEAYPVNLPRTPQIRDFTCDESFYRLNLIHGFFDTR